MHCADPECLTGCPTGSIFRDPLGQIDIDKSTCIGCFDCATQCPYDAITMVPRTDGKPFTSQAQVDPARCIGCGVCAGSCDSEGISVSWFDTRREGERIEHEIAGAIGDGASPHVAFVCGDIGDHGLLQQIVQTHRPWAVMNLAAETHVDRSIDSPRAFIDTNICGTWVLLDVARQGDDAGVHGILAASDLAVAVGAFDLAEEIESAHAGEVYIEEEQVWFVLFE